MVRNTSWNAPTVRDPLGDALAAFDKSYKDAQEARYEKEAPEAFASYLDTLGLKQGETGGIAPTGVDALVNGSHAAAEQAQDPLLTAYFANTRRTESGGNDAAKNPNSSATGRYQFLDSTWADLAKRHPELGLTPEGRTDPAQQEAAMRVFTQENARQLGSAGIKPNPGALYAAHFLGAGGASKVLAGDPNSPVSAYVDPGVIEANPQLANMTVGQFTQWANEKGGNASGGYAPPAATSASASGNGLPPRDVMLKLFQNPVTRPLAVELAKSAQAGTNPKPVEINNRLVDPMTGRVIADFSDENKPLTDLAKLRADLKAGRISQAEFDAAAAKETAINGGTTLSVDPATGAVTFQQGGSGGNMKLTEGQGKDLGFYTRGLQANEGLNKLESQLTDFAMSKADILPLGIGNYAKTPEFRQAKVEADNFLTALLRKDTGAAITPKEFELYGPMFLPVPGDDPGTIALKRQKRATALLALKSGLGTAEAIAAANEGKLGLSDPAAAAAGGAKDNLSGDKPPAGWTGDPDLWPYLTPEQRKLWQN